MVLAEEKQDKTPLFKRKKVRDAIEKLGITLFIGSFIALVLWAVFGLEAGVFSFSAVKVIVIPLAILGLSIVGACLLCVNGGDPFNPIAAAVLCALISTIVGGGIHSAIEPKQVQQKIGQAYEAKYHVDSPILSQVGTYETNHGKMFVYRVSSPELEKSEILAVQGHVNTIDSLKKISQEQFDVLKGLSKE